MTLATRSSRSPCSPCPGLTRLALTAPPRTLTPPKREVSLGGRRDKQREAILSIRPRRLGMAGRSHGAHSIGRFSERLFLFFLGGKDTSAYTGGWILSKTAWLPALDTVGIALALQAKGGVALAFSVLLRLPRVFFTTISLNQDGYLIIVLYYTQTVDVWLPVRAGVVPCLSS